MSVPGNLTAIEEAFPACLNPSHYKAKSCQGKGTRTEASKEETGTIFDLMKIFSACLTSLQGPVPLTLGIWEPDPTAEVVTGHSSHLNFIRLGEFPNDSLLIPFLDGSLRALSHICTWEHGTIAQFSTSIPFSAHSES